MKVDEETGTATFRDETHISKKASSEHREGEASDQSTGRRKRLSMQFGSHGGGNIEDDGSQHSNAANGVGRLGIKIHHLPKLPLLSSGDGKSGKPTAKKDELNDPGGLLGNSGPEDK